MKEHINELTTYYKVKHPTKHQHEMTTYHKLCVICHQIPKYHIDYQHEIIRFKWSMSCPSQ